MISNKRVQHEEARQDRYLGVQIHYFKHFILVESIVENW